MLSCYGASPDDATIALIAEELVRKHNNELASGASPHHKATIPIFTQFIIKNSFNKEAAFVQWKEYLKWSDAFGVDNITENDFPLEASTREAVWHGKDKGDRPCLVVTARLHRCEHTVGSGLSFQRFLVYTVESGLRLADREGQQEVCVLYDRRGMGYEHVDTALARHCQDTVSLLQHWYLHRLGKIYILHLGTFYWILYALLWPLASLFSSKIVIITDPKDLLLHFNESELPEDFIASGMMSPSGDGVEENGEENNRGDGADDVSDGAAQQQEPRAVGYGVMIEEKLTEKKQREPPKQHGDHEASCDCADDAAGGSSDSDMNADASADDLR